MSENLHEDFQLMSTPAFKFIREGSDINKILVGLRSLQRSDPRRFSVLWGVCRRLNFVEHLKYIPSNSRHFDPIQNIFRYNIERLSAYLTATCIEVVATKPYKDFPRWVKDVATSDLSNEKASKSLDNIQAMQRPFNADELYAYLKDLFDAYNSDHGLRRQFSQFFTALPSWMHEWLGEVYYIEKDDVLKTHLRIKESTWKPLDSKSRSRRVSEYLYSQVRSNHTHTVEYHPTKEGSAITGLNIDGVMYGFNNFHKNGDLNDKIEWSVGIKNNIPESEIIRLLVVYQLRAWIGVSDERSYIDSFLLRSNTRTLLHHILKEVQGNIRLIEWWYTRPLHRYTMQFAYQIYEPIFETEKAKSLLENYENSANMPLLHEVKNYIRSIETVNTKIIKFNADQEQSSGRLHADGFINELMSTSEIHWVMSQGMSIAQVIPQYIDNAMF